MLAVVVVIPAEECSGIIIPDTFVRAAVLKILPILFWSVNWSSIIKVDLSLLVGANSSIELGREVFSFYYNAIIWAYILMNS